MGFSVQRSTAIVCYPAALPKRIYLLRFASFLTPVLYLYVSVCIFRIQHIQEAPFSIINKNLSQRSPQKSRFQGFGKLVSILSFLHLQMPSIYTLIHMQMPMGIEFPKILYYFGVLSKSAYLHSFYPFLKDFEVF